MRKLAYTFGQQLLPRKGKFESLYYALDLNNPCNGETTEMQDGPVHKPGELTAPATDAIYVSPDGSDSASGTESAPLKSIQAGIDKAATGSKKVVLRKGTFFLAAAVAVTSKHSGVSVTAYPGKASACK
jgi:hypothetical protein